ncbi:hypothetical protein ACFFX1_07365 [Dactylosporangium sucinum]|nr:hypothetical protein [Dactylosporangium sucinum]
MGENRVHSGQPPRLVRWYGFAGCAAVAIPLVTGGGGYLRLAAAGAAAALLLVLVRPGTPPRPRGRMLAVAWPVAVAALVGGTLGVAAWPDSWTSFAVGVYGWSLAVVTASYQWRTRRLAPVHLPVTTREYAGAGARG